jgi:hypothetical protein
MIEFSVSFGSPSCMVITPCVDLPSVFNYISAEMLSCPPEHLHSRSHHQFVVRAACYSHAEDLPPRCLETAKHANIPRLVPINHPGRCEMKVNPQTIHEVFD